MYTVQLMKSKSKSAQKFYWRVIAKSGQILLTSERYLRRPMAIAKKFANNLDSIKAPTKFEDLSR